MARAVAGLAFRLDRLRWGEWGDQDVRLWFLASVCGSGLALAIAPRLVTAPVLRLIFVEALTYFVGGLLLDDVLRSRRRKTASHSNLDARPCFVYGSRGSGRRLAQEALRRVGELQPFGYLDDDPSLEETVVDGLPVLGCLDDLARLAAVHRVDSILAAERSLELEEAAELAGVQVRYRRKNE